jgi:transcriptional regulator with XRE-family HTH domain
MVLKDRIVELRKAKGQSQQDVADAVGVSKAHIWQLENGHALNPALSLVEKLALHFEVSVGDLIGEKIGGKRSDPELAGIFREVQKFDDRERQLLINFVQSIIETRPGHPRGHQRAMARALMKNAPK